MNIQELISKWFNLGFTTQSEHINQLFIINLVDNNYKSHAHIIIYNNQEPNLIIKSDLIENLI
jgi:hypothetical protein